MENIVCGYKEIEKIENLFPPVKEKKEPLGLLGYTKEEQGVTAHYNGNYCHFTVSFNNGSVENLSIYSFCLGYMINRNQIFRSFNEYQGVFRLIPCTENSCKILSSYHIHTFDFVLDGIGSGFIDRQEDSLQVSYTERTKNQVSKNQSYQFQIERLENESLFHIYDTKERKLLESFLLEGNKGLEDVPYCDLENKSLKKMFGECRNGNN